MTEVGAYFKRFLALVMLLLEADPTLLDRWAWVRRHLRHGPIRTLDAGSGSGAISLYAGIKGNDVIGVSNSSTDILRAQAIAIRAGYSTVVFSNLDLRQLLVNPLLLGEFDQILCLEVIEHVLDDSGLMKSLAAALRPNGVLLVTTPYKFYRRLLGDYVSDQEDGAHVRWGYTQEELSELLLEAGLMVVTKDYVSGFLSQRLTNLYRRMIRSRWACLRIMILPLRIVQLLDRPLTMLIQYPYLSLAIKARKPSA